MHADSGGDLVSTWAAKQRRACRGPDHLVNPVWKHYKRQRRAFCSSGLIPAGRCTGLLMGQARNIGCSVIHISLSSDRKSTRLNSSHLVISYAVFCLKKKNK